MPRLPNTCDLNEACRDFGRVAKASAYIDENRLDQPGLDEVAAHVGLSKYHFQRLFVRWAGVSPKQFLGFLTVKHVKTLLRSNENVLNTAYDTGLSGPGRLHDLFISYEAMTPGDYKHEGAGLTIRHGVLPTPFGEALILETDRGICGFSFIGSDGAEKALSEVRGNWPASTFLAETEQTGRTVRAIFGGGAGRAPIKLLLKGSRFQIKVWSALLALPAGQIMSYGDLAVAVGQSGAARAVGAALSHNPLALLVPCHRVLRQTGAFEGYRWGAVRKKALVGWEASHAEVRAAA